MSRKSDKGPDKTGGELGRDARELVTIEDRWHVLGDGRPPKKPPKKYKSTAWHSLRPPVHHMAARAMKLRTTADVSPRR